MKLRLSLLVCVLFAVVTSMTFASELEGKLDARWTVCMQRSIQQMDAAGAGAYNVSDDAKALFFRSFRWDPVRQRPLYEPQIPRYSFCSSAVYACVLYSLMQWDQSRHIPRESWLSLFPKKGQDGEGAWGYADSNAVGFALLVHELGCGFSFTDWAQARPYDIIKMWWTDAVGGKESGHIAVLIKDEGDSVLIWSSNQPRGNQKGGYGYRSYPKSKIKHVLFTRISNPLGFASALSIGFNQWLNDALRKDVSWEECLRHLGFFRN